MNYFACLDGVPGYIVTWSSKHVSFVRKDGVTKKVENWRLS